MYMYICICICIHVLKKRCSAHAVDPYGYVSHIYIYIYIYPVALRAKPATGPGDWKKEGHERHDQHRPKYQAKQTKVLLKYVETSNNICPSIDQIS